MAKPDMPILTDRSGTLPEQVDAIRLHIFLAEERLNYVLSHLDHDNFTRPIWAKLIETGGNIKTNTVSLPVADWVGNEQTVSVVDVTASSVVIVSPSPSSYDDYASAAVYCSAQGSGTLTFVCGVVPSSDLTVNIIIAEAAE